MPIQTITRGLTKVFGTRNDRLVKGFRKRVEQVNAFESQITELTDAQLRERVVEMRQAIESGDSQIDDLKFEALAIMRETLDRNVGIRNIFNPQFSERFPFDKLPADVMGQVERLRAEIDALQPEQVLGSEEPIPGFMQVDIPNSVYNAVREIFPESRPPFRCRPFDVQLIGALVLHSGSIAEMKTGEGKTIVAPMACFLASLEGMQCHVVTVNDYLVQRDRDWVFPAFHRLGLSVGAIHPYHMQPPEMKQQMYHCNVVYGTNSEFGFDYLRDNMKLSVREQVQRRRNFCIVDEIDSILIDEARTPLVISGPAHDDAPQYMKADNVAIQLVARQKSANQESARRITADGFAAQQARAWKTGEAAIEKIIQKFRDLGPDFVDEKEAEQIDHTQYYVCKRDQKSASMTALGVEEAQKIIGTRFYVVGNDMAWDHLINQALRAHAVYECDREYVVKDGEVVIVDEFTGRLMVGRQWSDGLHQAIEAKESKRGVKIKQETQTLATITIQNFFKLYDRLAGMTGTALTEATEFMEIYQLDVISIPTNRPVIRDDREDLIFITEKAKWSAIIENIKENCENGRPVLVGTTSVDKSEMLSQLLTKKHGIEHEVLNAKQHEREAHIVENAGQQRVDRRGRTVGNVMIATNMAGRGTDIRLSPEVLELGGLHIIGTERHESRRIDNQLRGRAGRQGDPGSSRFFISMEDDLMKMFAGGKTIKALEMLGMKEDDAIEHRWISRSVERAQRKVEERNFQIRKNLLEYDEVMEYQRNSFYSTRQTTLEGQGIDTLILDYIAESIEDACAEYLRPQFVPERVVAGARDALGVAPDPSRIRGMDLEDAVARIRSDARSEVAGEIETTIGEYMDDDIPAEDWDTKGLSGWAMSRFRVDLKQSQIKQQDQRQIADSLIAAAHEQIDKKSLDGLAAFFEPGYVAGEITEWAKKKFGLELDPAEMDAQPNEKHDAAQQRVAELIYKQASEAYARREIVYPVDFVLEMAFGAARQSEEGSAWAADNLCKWAKARLDLDWTPEQIKTRTGDQLREELITASEQWHNGKLSAWVDGAVSEAGGDIEALAEAFERRWNAQLNTKELESIEDAATYVGQQANLILRAELTQLEQYVLLQILDQTWKDHLYAMDQLKDTINLRGFGEKDPKIEFKREGSRMFQQMQSLIKDKVTDLIFRAKLTANVQMRDSYANQQAHHQKDADTGAPGVQQPATEQQRADLAAAERAGSAGQTTQTIVNKSEKYGRNDRVVVENPATGEKQEVKYKKAQTMQHQGWRVIGKA